LVEAIEKQHNSQLCRTFKASLPNAWTYEVAEVMKSNKTNEERERANDRSAKEHDHRYQHNDLYYGSQPEFFKSYKTGG